MSVRFNPTMSSNPYIGRTSSNKEKAQSPRFGQIKNLENVLSNPKISEATKKALNELEKRERSNRENFSIDVQDGLAYLSQDHFFVNVTDSDGVKMHSAMLGDHNIVGTIKRMMNLGKGDENGLSSLWMHGCDVDHTDL